MIRSRIQPESRNGAASHRPQNGAAAAAALGSSAASTRRLWRPLSYRAARPRQLTDVERAGDKALGAARRAVRSQRRLLRHAEEVMRLSETMTECGERSFDEFVEQAREAARRGRIDIAARTHAFATVREAIRRTVGLKLYIEQVMGGWVMADGGLAEMLTGEGKTVTACLSAAVQGWMGYGVHVVTVNDYLARRDAEINSAIYRRLGLSVGVIQHESENADRRDAYSRDITYTTDQQLIFDYLRDRLHSPLQPRVSSLLLDEITDTELSRRSQLWTERVVQRGLYAAIIDEADSVLIDQATTPAIIGAPTQEDAASEYYRVALDLASTLELGHDYIVDIQQKHVGLHDRGRAKLEESAHLLPPFWSGPRRREELVTLALTATHLFRRDDHYIVRDNDVHIVDPQTGRVLEGRQWQQGLHQMMQAKENLTVTGGRQTMARMSYQRFFQLYKRLAGMTGTAWEVRDEIWQTYHLPVLRIPPHRPVIRRSEPDRYHLDRDSKFNAVADEIAAHHRRGRPVLVGTRSVDASERLSELLTERALAHRVLNAVRHEEEAVIIAAAGKQGAITVATNMAGRGTDILLGPGVRELGGLVVIATERHDSRRIDRQLYGRAGRQGDPGLAQTFVSLDDQLIQKAGLRPLIRLILAFANSQSMLRRFGLPQFLWRQAQRAASRREAVVRDLVSRSDLMFDRALYYENR